jgi:NTP pyrophosphatase (non-canonical NTP hydrolase)
MTLQEFREVVRQAQEEQNRTNLQLSTWLMVEAAELSDHILKEAVYDRKVDEEELVKEIGDVLHFLEIIAQRYNLTLEDAMVHNKIKLQARGWIK